MWSSGKEYRVYWLCLVYYSIMDQFLFLTLTLSLTILSSIVNALHPNLCINCKHFTKSNYFTNDEFGRCKKFPKSSKYDENYIDFLVTGKKKDINIEDYPYCSIIRNDDVKCGVLGISYESKKNM
jgi:hypothetical protein